MRTRFRIAHICPFVVLVFALGITSATWGFVRRSVEREEQVRFERTSQKLLKEMEHRLESYVNAFQGARGLFAASKLVEPSEWRDYVVGINLPVSFPGMRALGFLKRVKAAEKNEFLAFMRANGAPGYAIWPEENRTEYYPVAYVTAPEEVSADYYGFDFATDSPRLPAMAVARDRDIPAGTPERTLLLEPEATDGINRRGFFIFHAVYRNGMPRETVSERRAALEGYVTAWIRTRDFFDHILSKNSIPGIDAEVYDCGDTVLARLIYSFESNPTHSAGPRPRLVFVEDGKLRLGDASWTIRIMAHEGFGEQPSRGLVGVVLAAGLVVSVLLSGLTWVLVTGRERALALAEKMTANLRSREDQLRQSQKMESIGQLAGGLAHDFNSILMLIQYHAEVLKDGISPGSALSKSIEGMDRAVLRAANLIKQLLALGRRQAVNLVPLNLNEVVSEAINMLKPLLGSTVEIQTFLAADIGGVRADAALLDQVLMNLAVNARDAMPRGGRLTVATRRVVLDKELVHPYGIIAPGEYAVLSVTDTGEGIPAHARARIFEPFFTTKPTGKGTGLGLAMVYGIVKQHGACIICESEPGKGATFRIYLPAVAEK